MCNQMIQTTVVCVTTTWTAGSNQLRTSLFEEASKCPHAVLNRLMRDLSNPETEMLAEFIMDHFVK